MKLRNHAPDAYETLRYAEQTRGLEYLRAALAACDRQTEALDGPYGERVVVEKRLIDQFVRERDLETGARKAWIDRLMFAGIGFVGAIIGGWANAHFTGM